MSVRDLYRVLDALYFQPGDVCGRPLQSVGCPLFLAWRCLCATSTECWMPFIFSLAMSVRDLYRVLDALYFQPGDVCGRPLQSVGCPLFSAWRCLCATSTECWMPFIFSLAMSVRDLYRVLDALYFQPGDVCAWPLQSVGCPLFSAWRCLCVTSTECWMPFIFSLAMSVRDLYRVLDALYFQPGDVCARPLQSVGCPLFSAWRCLCVTSTECWMPFIFSLAMSVRDLYRVLDALYFQPGDVCAWPLQSVGCPLFSAWRCLCMTSTECWMPFIFSLAMSVRDLVDGECGGSNALVKLTSHYTQDRSRRQVSKQAGMALNGLYSPWFQD